MPLSPFPRIPSANLVALALASLLGACTSFATPHQTYAPLLDHQGQLDLLVRGNFGVAGDEALFSGGGSAAVAWAPVDNLELVAGGDAFFAREGIRRYAGQLGVGVFARDDVLRLEAIAGVFGGTSRGLAERNPDEGELRYRVEGPYVAPYVQVFAGYEWARIEMAWGVRMLGFVSDVRVRPLSGSPPLGTASRYSYEHARLEPSFNARVKLSPMVRLDITLTTSIHLAGDRFPGAGEPGIGSNLLATDIPFSAFVGVGLGIQLDTTDPPPRPEPPLDEPLEERSAPQGVYAPPR